MLSIENHLSKTAEKLKITKNLLSKLASSSCGADTNSLPCAPLHWHFAIHLQSNELRRSRQILWCSILASVTMTHQRFSGCRWSTESSTSCVHWCTRSIHWTCTPSAGLRPNWAWCCCPEKGLFSSRHSRQTKTYSLRRNHPLLNAVTL